MSNHYFYLFFLTILLLLKLFFKIELNREEVKYGKNSIKTKIQLAAWKLATITDKFVDGVTSLIRKIFMRKKEEESKYE